MRISEFRSPLGLVAALIVAGCVRPTPVPVSKPMSDAVKIAVLSTLKDPLSAQFGDQFSAVKAYDHLRVCGIVNAKNSFGGYTGPQVFVAIYYPETGQALVENLMGGDPSLTCALSNTGGYSTAPPASVLAAHGIGIPEPSRVPSDNNMKKRK